MAVDTSGGSHTDPLGHSLLYMITLNKRLVKPFDKDLKTIYRPREERKDYNVT